jgi:D-alanyl-lipoteichoic acid acyltransferase DltB (MBOAT superfamily)
MKMDFIWQNIYDALSYSEKAPILFNSGLFMVMFIVFTSIYALFYNHTKARVAYILAFSIYFYYKSSGLFVLNLIFCVIFNYYLGKKIPLITSQKLRTWVVAGGIVLNIAFLMYFKYTNFLLSNLSYLVNADFTRLDIFLPIGISFYTFQTVSYLVDVHKERIEPCSNVWDFGFYLSFFPQLVAGPIVRAKDFLPQIHQKINFTREDMGDGLFMVLKGLVKKALIADYLAQYVDIVYSNPSGYSGFENLMAMYAYTLQIYCDFSGYSDMAIGLALILGFKLPENFRSPYNSKDITEFWRRWHISLSTWLRDYIYIPLGGNRHGVEKQYLFLMLTMLIGGFWHGADWKFVFWGGMHGAGLIIHKIFNETAREMEWNTKLLTPLGWVITFHFVAFLWVFFRADSFGVAALSINKIVFDFDWAYLLPFLQTRGLLFLMMGIGYALHFTPEKDKNSLREYYGTLPVLVKAVILLLIIQAVLQVQNENVQPFIYFQF